MEQNRPFGCKCTKLAHKLTGDGCDECNPEYAKQVDMEQTPIEELIKQSTESFCEAGYYFEYVKPEKVIELLKAYREKHKHTKEEVEQAYKQGFGECVQDFASNVDAYYERTFNK